MSASNPYEYYATPAAFTRWLFIEMAGLRRPIMGTILEPCVGDGAIPRAVHRPANVFGIDNAWFTNDLDTRWAANEHADASQPHFWQGMAVDWTVGNPPFTPAIDIITHALDHSHVGVAMHLRASIHEVLKTGIRRTWMARHQPTGILWLPRFAYQRSPKTGEWTTDSVCACWVIWLKDPAAPQFIRYAPESVLEKLDLETPDYRRRMDQIMAERQAVSA